MDENKILKEMLEAILSEREISEVQMFLERPSMVEAIRKVLFLPIISNGVMKPGEVFRPGVNYMLQLVGSQYAQAGMINNEALAQDVLARWKATELIQGAFKDLESLKKVAEIEKVKGNKAL